jgi:tetratricopeptide (TPR) repeat protein
VALKTIPPAYLSGPQAWERFHLEASAASRLDHPNIVPIYEVGERDGFCFYSMKLVEGATIEQLVASGLPDAEACRHITSILVKVALAVHHAHQRGVLHRDLKPSNILLDQEHEPHVSDFGLARQTTQDSSLTATQSVIGTPAYLAPEVAAGGMRQATVASDIYALGAIIYYLLTGRPPFSGETLAATLRAVQENEPTASHLINPSAPGNLETICLKCLQKEPAQRYATAQALAEDLKHFLCDEPILARPATRVERMWRWCRRKPALAVAIGLLLLLLLVIGIGSPIAIYRINQARRQAQTGEQQATAEAAKSKEIARVLEDMLAAAGPSVARGRDATLLKELLDKTAARVQNELKDQPEIQGDLNSTLASTYRDLDDFQKAKVLQQLAVDEYRRAFGDQHPKLALALGRLGFTQRWLSNDPAGKETASAGLEMARKCADKSTLAESLYYMARSLAQHISAREGEPYLREAVAIQRDLGDDPATLGKYMGALADCLIDSNGNQAEAEHLLREALDLHRQLLGNDDPRVASDLYGLAQCLQDQHKLEEAKAAAIEAVEVGRKIFRKDHLSLRLFVACLSSILITRGEWSDAEALLHRAIEDSPSSAALWNELGFFEARRQQWAAATADFARALELDPQGLKGSIPPLAIALLRTDRVEEYRQLCHRFLELSANSRDFDVANNVAKLSLLLPVEGTDFDRACQLADFAATANESLSANSWYAHCKALADYRRNRFDSALNWANRAITNVSVGVHCKSATFFVQALAYARLRNVEAARAALAAGDNLVKEAHPDPRDFGEWPCDWAIVDFLRSEAQRQINDNL